ncbi:type IVB secretion system protein IcmH/DotU [Pseudomonas sp. NyZ480]|uniref:type IVB secretion system protein IcmH/DotU n=1 Tax=Pseudomonas sp. NyZ480 TaxID=3035289 RepID=UPI002409510B|nr:type IVB secretion system protein IcmH/DotU [Pseudomonas sp. NyZ480]WEZ90542.1 type IVB secretion system protein IcmH/DotU [Pseudomonas sp. NyZ480]
MSKDTEHPQDDKTVLYNQDGSAPSGQPLTAHGDAAKVEPLEQRMVYSARLPASGSFSVGLNPLVAAAAELISEVVRLKHSETAEDLNTLKERLSAYIRTFEARIHYEGVESSQVTVARYLICTVVDEAVVTTSWGNESQWSQMSLLSAFHNETFGGEKFFALLDRMSKNPVKHLAMLELMYLCLSLGFEGKYRVIDRGMSELEGIRDALFRQIRQLRGDVPRELAPRWEGHDQRHTPVRIVPWWSVALLTMVCLMVLYAGFAWVLGEQRATVLQPFQPLEQNVAEQKQ